MRKWLSFLFLFSIVLTTATFAEQGVRYRDEEVKKLIEQAADTSDDFKDAFKKVESMTTRTGVPVDVQQYMNDYEETFKRFKEGFESKAAVNSDLVTLLRMTTEIDRVMLRNPDAAGAGSEWQAHKFNMERLAQAFRTTLEEGADPPRRLSDAQLGALMKDLKQNSKSLGNSAKDAMKKDKSIDKSTRESAEQSLKNLEKQAERLSDLFEDKDPLFVEMQQFFRQKDEIKSIVNNYQLGSKVQSDLNTLESNSDRLAAEYDAK
jgi:hypothetical protein